MRKYYKTCETLPLKNFFKVIESNDYKYLVIADDYDFEFKEDLSELWGVIMHEYAELEGGSNVLEKFDALKEIYQLAATYDILNAMIYILHYKYIKEYVNDLAMFGYIVEIENNCITKTSLDKCSQMSRSILNEIDDLKKIVDTDSEKGKSNNLFYKCMAWLIKGYGNLEDNITVAKYVALKNHLNKLIRSENGRDKR